MSKRARISFESPVVEVWKREIGQLPTRNFAHRLAASEDLVLRLDLLHNLDKHRGCVNTVSFNASGDILVSGSDDKRIILWDWETGHIKQSFHSGHHNNVFQAKIMPFTDDRSIVTCAADGQVRHAQLLECGKVETKKLAEHQGRAHKLSVEPGSPYIFYTCGEDGLVQHIDLRSGTATRLFTCKSLVNEVYLSTVRLNTIAIDPRNPNFFSVGGSDQFARLYDIRKYNWDASSKLDQPVDFFCPPNLIDDEHVGITGLAFSDQRELLVSYNDEFIYLFTKDSGLGPNPTITSQVSVESDRHGIVHDTGSTLSNSNAKTESAPQAYKGHRNCETVKGVNFFGPKCEYVVSGSDCGRIFIWRKKGGELIRVIEADKHVVNCIESHPHVPVLASSGIEHDIKIWIPKSMDRAILPPNIEKGNAQIARGIGFFLLGGYDDDEDDDFDDEDDDDDDDDDSDDGDSYDDDVDCFDDDECDDDSGRSGECGGDEVLNEDEPKEEEESSEDYGVDLTVGDSHDNDDINNYVEPEDFHDVDDGDSYDDDMDCFDDDDECDDDSGRSGECAGDEVLNEDEPKEEEESSEDYVVDLTVRDSYDNDDINDYVEPEDFHAVDDGKDNHVSEEIDYDTENARD